MYEITLRARCFQGAIIATVEKPTPEVKKEERVSKIPQIEIFETREMLSQG